LLILSVYADVNTILLPVFFVSSGLISPLDTEMLTIKLSLSSYIIAITKTAVMARQSGLYFKGRMGNIVGSTWKGIPYLRYMPDTINQSEATKQSSANMAQASRIGAAFRKSFAPLLPQTKGRAIQNRFTGAVKKWLQTKPFQQTLPSVTAPYLLGFEFNEASPVEARFRVTVSLEEKEKQSLQLQVNSFVPTQNIVAPAYTKTVNLKMAVAQCQVDSCAVTANYFHELSVDYNSDTVPAQFISLPFTAEEGNIVLMLLSLQYYTANGMVTDERWMPCGIVAAYVR